MTSEVVGDRREGNVPAGSPVRVLVADDAADLRELMQAVLEGTGVFTVVGEAADGAEAVVLAERYQPDLVLVDVAMPVMGGLQAIPEIRRRAPNTRIAVLTVLHLRDLEQQALAVGADLCLDKTRAPGDLVDALAGLVGVKLETEAVHPAEAWATQALRESRAGSDGAFDEAAIGMAFTDLDGRPLRVNAALCRILRRPAHEVMGRRLWDWGVPEPVAGWPGGSPPGAGGLQLEQRWTRADGTNVWVTVDAAAVHGADGQALYVFCQIQDATDRRHAQDALRASEERYRTLVEALDEGVVLVDGRGVAVASNASAQRLVGMTNEELMRVDPLDTGWVTLREDGSTFPVQEQPPALALRSGRQHRAVIGVRRPGGDVNWLSVLATPLAGPGAKPRGAVISFTDVTATRNAELALRESENSFRLLAEHSSDLIARNVPGGAFVYVSPSCRTILGYEPEEMVGRLPVDFIHPEDGASVPGVADTGADDTVTIRFRHRSGHWVWLEVNRHAVHDPRTGDVVEVHTSSRDVTEHIELEARLTELALRDGLTGLANRVVLTDRLEHSLARRDLSGAPLAVLFIDLDQFKRINDTFGHAVGDGVLVGVADRLRHVVRPSDTAARLGGDEFVVVCEDLGGEAEAVAVAERIEAALAEPHSILGLDLVVTASIGIALAELPTAAEIILHRADQAMYAAKEAGRACHRVAR